MIPILLSGLVIHKFRTTSSSEADPLTMTVKTSDISSSSSTSGSSRILFSVVTEVLELLSARGGGGGGGVSSTKTNCMV